MKSLAFSGVMALLLFMVLPQLDPGVVWRAVFTHDEINLMQNKITGNWFLTPKLYDLARFALMGGLGLGVLSTFAFCLSGDKKDDEAPQIRILDHETSAKS